MGISQCGAKGYIQYRYGVEGRLGGVQLRREIVILAGHNLSRVSLFLLGDNDKSFDVVVRIERNDRIRFLVCIELNDLGTLDDEALGLAAFPGVQ